MAHLFGRNAEIDFWKAEPEMKKRSEKQQDLDNLKTDLAKVSTVILSTFQGITVEEDNKLRRAVEQAGGK